MSTFPYYRWYPADAKADEKYASMNDFELGFYHRCLDHSWLNDGLPCDLDELARIMKVTKPYITRIWRAVGKCFFEQDGRLFNPRQEKEREWAIAQSKKNSAASAHGQSNGAGFIYLIRRGDGSVKIGSALNVPRRLAQLRYKYRAELILVDSFPVANMSESEVSLHEKFKAKRLLGEWFTLTDQDVGDIRITLRITPTGDNQIHPKQRAYDSDSDPVSDSVSDSSSAFKEKTTLREIPKTREITKTHWPAEFDFAAWIEERDRKHPLAGAPQLAIQYAQDQIFVKFTPTQFDESHDAWCEYWKGQDGGIPTLAKFIHEAWWRKRPPIREPPKKKQSFVEGVEQVFRERIKKEGKPW